MNYRIIDISCFLIFFAACVYCTSFYYYPTELMWAPDNDGWLYYADYLFGNFTHFNLHHLCENLIGLFIIWFFFYSSSVDGFLDKTASLLVSALSVTICLYFFTNIDEYGGLSGALHGMVAYAALLRYIKDRDIKGFFLLCRKIFPSTSFLRNFTATPYYWKNSWDLNMIFISVYAKRHISTVL